MASHQARGPRLLLVLLLAVIVGGAGAAVTEPVAVADEDPAPEAAAAPAEPTFSVLVANIGNVSPWCVEQVFKLCHLAVEARIIDRIGPLRPDLVALTEVLNPELCDDATVSALSPFNSCSLPSQDPPQAVRLLGEGYAIACADRTPWDCIAVNTEVGSVAGCPEGYCGGVLEVRPVEDGCDDGFQVFLADVTVRGVAFTAIVAHPDSMDVECRAAAVEDLFAQVPDEGETLLLGDMNLDPYRTDPGSDRSVAVWSAHVGAGARFAYLSGIAEHDPPYLTLVPAESQALDPTGELTDGIAIEHELAFAATVDHVAATRGLGGSCVTLGEAPGTERLDGGGGMDHRALSCVVGPVRAITPEPPRVEDTPGTELPATGSAAALVALGLVLVAMSRMAVATRTEDRTAVS